jgi:hypothetical protein
MKIRIKHNETEIEMEFTSSATKDKVDVMKIISHVAMEFKAIREKHNEASIIQNKQQTGGTPFEKAKELVNLFKMVNAESVELETGENELLFSLSHEDAKQCALIAVDEIVSELRDNDENFERETSHGVYVYWDVVKKEIQKQ